MQLAVSLSETHKSPECKDWRRKLATLLSMLDASGVYALYSGRDLWSKLPILHGDGMEARTAEQIKDFGRFDFYAMVQNLLHRTIMEGVEKGILNAPPPVYGQLFQ